MRLILKTSSNNEHYDGDCHYAVVDIDDALRCEILKYREMWHKLHEDLCGPNRLISSLYKITFWSDAAMYLSDYEGLRFMSQSELHDFDNDENVARLDEQQELHLGDEPWQRTECDQLVVDDEHFYWTAIPKHSDVAVSTYSLEYEWLTDKWFSAEAAKKVADVG